MTAFVSLTTLIYVEVIYIFLYEIAVYPPWLFISSKVDEYPDRAKSIPNWVFRFIPLFISY